MKIREDGERMMAGLRLFVADLPNEKRLRQRVEAAIMNCLYAAAPPLCGLPDCNMHLRPRRADEAEITITNHVCGGRIYDLPETMII